MTETRGSPSRAHQRAPEALLDLLGGIIDYDRRAGGGGLPAIAAAAALAFGFVYVHPFVDGNGRLHRWLIHHVLAAAGYNPPGIVFPISAAILRRIDAYRAVLESYSSALLPLIDWRPTADGNVRVLADTADYYRYFRCHGARRVSARLRRADRRARSAGGGSLPRSVRALLVSGQRADRDARPADRAACGYFWPRARGGSRSARGSGNFRG
jgi:hypothetical protein